VPETLLVSVGGGGLIAGLAAWFGGRGKVVGVEPELAPTLYRARAAARPVDVDVGGIAADALGAPRIGRIAWDIAQKHVADALLLDDAAIRAAQVFLWRELKLGVEPAAALPLAALQTGRVVPRAGERVCLVVCGANVDPASLG
jgi:threonine dehydratase